MSFAHVVLEPKRSLFDKSRSQVALCTFRIVAIGVAIGILLLTAGTARAALLAYEGFGYQPGAALTGQGNSSDPGWAGSWNKTSGDADVLAGSLVYSDLEYSGNSATLGADQYCRANRFPDTSAGGPFGLAGLVDGGKIGADGTTLYLSFLQRIATVPSGSLPYYAIELSDGNGNADRVLLVGHDDKATPYYVARTYSNESGSEISTSLGTENADVNFYVLKFSFGAGDDDLVEIYRNPSLGGEPAAPTATLGGLSLGYDFSFDRIALARFVGNTPIVDFDEIRFGTTFADVAPVPEPGSLVLLLAAGFCLLLIGAGRRMRHG